MWPGPAGIYRLAIRILPLANSASRKSILRPHLLPHVVLAAGIHGAVGAVQALPVALAAVPVTVVPGAAADGDGRSIHALNRLGPPGPRHFGGAFIF